MKEADIAYKMGALFDKKITSYYFESYKGIFGKVQVDVLNYLYDHQPATAVRLAENITVPKQHISKIIQRFEEENLVDIKPSRADGRVREITLTEKGKDLVRAHIQVSDQHFKEVTDRLSKEDKDHLIASMKDIVRILEKMP